MGEFWLAVSYGRGWRSFLLKGLIGGLFWLGTSSGRGLVCGGVMCVCGFVGGGLVVYVCLLFCLVCVVSVVLFCVDCWGLLLCGVVGCGVMLAV
jgi:hypothetical protein